MRLILSWESVLSTSKEAHVNCDILAKYLKAYSGITPYEVKDVIFSQLEGFPTLLMRPWKTSNCSAWLLTLLVI